MRTFYRIYKIKYVLNRIKKEVYFDWEMLWFRVLVQTIYTSVISSRVNITLLYQRCVSLKGDRSHCTIWCIKHGESPFACFCCGRRVPPGKQITTSGRHCSVRF